MITEEHEHESSTNDPVPCLPPRYLFCSFVFITMIIFSSVGRATSLPDQEIQVTCHRHEPRTMGPTTPTATTTTGRRPPQPGTPCRGQGHLCRRASSHQGNREERIGAVGTPAATRPNQGGREGRTGAVGTPAAAPPNQVGGEGMIGTVGSLAAAPSNQVGREGKIGIVGSLAAAPPNRVVREDKIGAADTPAAAPPNQVCREERTGAVDTPAAAGLEAGRRKATGAETTNAANEPGTPHGSTPVAAVAHAADVNTLPGTTHESKGVCPVNTTNGTGVHGPRRAPTEVTEGAGRMTLATVPAVGGASPAASGAANTPYNAKGTLRGHPNRNDAPTQPKNPGRNENVPTSSKVNHILVDTGAGGGGSYMSQLFIT